MTLDILVLDSGHWLLGEELAARPWHVLIYRQRSEPRNELHVWLPHPQARGSADLAFRRYWLDDDERWCVEAPGDPDRPHAPARLGDGSMRLRFSCNDGRVLWAHHRGSRGLGDLSDYELGRLRDGAEPGTYSA